MFSFVRCGTYGLLQNSICTSLKTSAKWLGSSWSTKSLKASSHHILLLKNINWRKYLLRVDYHLFTQRLESIKSFLNTVCDGDICGLNGSNGFLELCSLLQSPFEHLTPSIYSASNRVLSHRFIYCRCVPFQFNREATHINTIPFSLPWVLLSHVHD